MPEERREEREAPGGAPAEGGDDQVDAPGADKPGDGKDRPKQGSPGESKDDRLDERDAGGYDV